MIRIYNTLTRQLEELKPLEDRKIRLYVCGMTVYDFCHIGHARVMVFFDVVVRYLRCLGYEVIYVRNITDIDDKIIQRACANQEDWQALTTRFIQALHEDSHALNILPPDIEPCATQYIQKMQELIRVLIEKKHAYIARNGDVCYAVRQFAQYGELAHQDIDKLRAGARVSIVDGKEDPLDFVLWKLAKPNEPAWDSPWGAGRPGWHIECSAMSLDCLGEQFDIHGGGFDLIFPHHQNEIAQSEGATGKRAVNQWMHVGFVTVNKEKMSKSLGNFFTIREVLQQYPAETVRYFMLTSHYRSGLNYALEMLDNANLALERFYLALRGVNLNSANINPKDFENNIYAQRFHAVMQEDFNTPEALAVLFDLTREINRVQQQDEKQPEVEKLAGMLKHLGGMLGILQQDPQVFLQGQKGRAPAEGAATEEQILALIARRDAARQGKDWAAADSIRKELEAMGILIEDAATGTSWRRAS